MAFSIASYGAGSFATCQLNRKVLSRTIAPKWIMQNPNAVGIIQAVQGERCCSARSCATTFRSST